MTNETKAPTEEEVHQDARLVRDGQPANTHRPWCKCTWHLAVERLKSAALLGTQVPGLVADNAALTQALRSIVYVDCCGPALGLGARAHGAASDVLMQPHPGAALLAEHEAKVSALQARLKEAEDEHTAHVWKTTEHVRALEARVAELERERDGAKARSDGLVDACRDLGAEQARLSSERDSLRAQVLQAQDAAYSTAFVVWGDAVRARQVADAVGAALPAPPSEMKKSETCGMARYVQHDIGPDHRITEPCSFAPNHNGGHSWESSAETHAPERQEETQPTCAQCGRAHGNGYVIYVCDQDEGGCGKDVCGDCSENVGQVVVCLECHDRK